MSLNKSLESRFFSAGVGVWSPKFSNPEVGIPQNKNSTCLINTTINDQMS